MSQQEISQALAEISTGGDLAGLAILAALVEQIDDADLVIEHPQLAARLLTGQNERKAA